MSDSGTGTLVNTRELFSPAWYQPIRLDRSRSVQHPVDRDIDHHFQPVAGLTFWDLTGLNQGGDGILTVCPSSTPYGLDLGPD